MENKQNLYQEMKDKISWLTKENQKLKKTLFDFGWPSQKPVPKADINYWKDKYKRLMDEKIHLERERTKLFEGAEKLIKILKENNIPFKEKDFEGIINSAGISLIPGNNSKNMKLNYEPFNNKF